MKALEDVIHFLKNEGGQAAVSNECVYVCMCMCVCMCVCVCVCACVECMCVNIVKCMCVCAYPFV